MSDLTASRGRILATESVLSTGPAIILIYTMWVFVLFEPHWMLAGGGVVQRAILLLSIPMLILAVQYGRSGDLYWPMLLYTVLHLTAWPTSMNRGYVQVGFIDMARITILFTATAALCKTPDRVLWLVKLFLLSFVWYGLQGLVPGTVGWHPALGNPDGFGGLMLIGIGVGFCAATSSVTSWRYVGYTTFALGLLGVVSSFARGAVLGAVLVLVVLWLRSQQKILTAAAGMVVVAVMIPAIGIIHPEGEFWREMQTITEGTASGTGADRKDLWGVAIEVWKQNPIFGVGTQNTGVVASKLFEFGEIEGRYSQPGRLYDRAIHNTYLQLLAEQGVVGVSLWLAMLAGVLLRLRRLREPALVAAWNRAVAGQFDLHRVTIGLELAVVGFMAGAFFYNQAYRHWIYTLIILSLLVERTALHESSLRSAPAELPTQSGSPGAGKAPRPS